jgi:predicted RNA-binding Zn-ribbon protein involved in translation (DUF1610 family)
MNKEEYNEVPVHYCNHCGSLLIVDDDYDVPSCADCGRIEISITSIENWEKYYVERYGRKFV